MAVAALPAIKVGAELMPGILSALEGAGGARVAAEGATVAKGGGGFIFLLRELFGSGGGAASEAAAGAERGLVESEAEGLQGFVHNQKMMSGEQNEVLAATKVPKNPVPREMGGFANANPNGALSNQTSFFRE